MLCWERGSPNFDPVEAAVVVIVERALRYLELMSADVRVVTGKGQVLDIQLAGPYGQGLTGIEFDVGLHDRQFTKLTRTPGHDESWTLAIGRFCWELVIFVEETPRVSCPRPE